MRKYRIIQWGLGYTGAFSLKYILGNAHLELVGARCFTAAKEGRDAGELCGLGRCGVTATQNVASLLELDADCVIFMPRDLLTDPSVPDSPSEFWVKEMVALLESGKNVVASPGAGAHWRQMARGEEFRDRLNAACKKGGSTVFFTGFDPGFSTDVLAFTMSSVVGDIEQIRIWEIIDVSTYTGVAVLQQLGLGARPQDLPPQKEMQRPFIFGWSGALHLLGDALGVSVEDAKFDYEMCLAPKTYTTPGGLTVKEGTIAALRWSLSGIVDGRPRFVIKKVYRTAHDAAPDWPTLGADGGYRVEIDAFPPFRGDFPMGLPGGLDSTFADAMAMTAARCINSIEAVVKAEPGYKTFLDLPPLGGKYALAR